ncbi:GNAT family N-acetyltransferase [Flavobacterium sp. W22_SRS_FK3]|uniref:GNAT family N-acetyltransferase n=1 Tax=Flavobacterium sp. W22_SRS_FK3 TaxID=3240275 RepID=UPI003F90040B
MSFETYVALGLNEFYKNFDIARDCVSICEHYNNIVGFVLLMHRENNSAQLRYFYLEPEYRGIVLGKKFMNIFMAFLNTRAINPPIYGLLMN